MEDINQKDTLELLAEAEKFCKGIDAFTDILGISKRKVTALRNDVHVLKHLAEDNSGFTQDFISYNIVCVQAGLNALIVECTLCPDFTQEIGEALGIQNPFDNKVRLKTEFSVKWSKPITDVRELLGTKIVRK